MIPGHEFTGDVIEIGDNVTDYEIGERLAVAPDVHCGKCYYCQLGLFNLCDDLKLVGITPGFPGGFAETAILTRDILTNGIVHPIPQSLDYDGAALAEPASSVLATHAKCGTNPASTVVVLGGGPIGCLHIVVSKAYGARVILSEPAQVRRDLAARFFPDLVIDPQQTDAVSEIREFTHGLGADVVICANPVAATQTQAVEMVRKGGKVMLFGGLPKAAPMTSLDANRIHYGEISVIGTFSYHPSFHELALDMIKRGIIPAEKIITHKYSLDEIAAAFNAAAGGDALKVIVQI
jgi:L-iditol 2-dehydrogenase